MLLFFWQSPFSEPDAFDAGPKKFYLPIYVKPEAEKVRKKIQKAKKSVKNALGKDAEEHKILAQISSWLDNSKSSEDIQKIISHLNDLQHQYAGHILLNSYKDLHDALQKLNFFVSEQEQDELLLTYLI